MKAMANGQQRLKVLPVRADNCYNPSNIRFIAIISSFSSFRMGMTLCSYNLIKSRRLTILKEGFIFKLIVSLLDKHLFRYKIIFINQYFCNLFESV